MTASNAFNYLLLLLNLSGCGATVAHQLPKLRVAGSNPVARSRFLTPHIGASTDRIQYFYEPFLQAFDPSLRKQLRVWYTPTKIVKYMVERVDSVLSEESPVALPLNTDHWLETRA